MEKDVVIFGAGSMARIAYVYLTKDEQYKVKSFTVHEEYIREKKIFDLRVVPFRELGEIFPPSGYRVFVAMGFVQVNRGRAEVYQSCKELGYELISYVSSQACIWDEVKVGESCFIMENAAIQPFASIGDDVVICSGAHIGHDVRLSDHCFIGPNAVLPGNVRIGEYSFVGANATVRDGVTIAPGCIIGAGATILKDTKEDTVYLHQHTEAASISSAAFRSMF